jgi:hypothetical protein
VDIEFDERYHDDNSLAFHYTLVDVLGLLASNIVSSSDLEVYLREEELKACFPATQQEGLTSYLGKSTPSFSFAKVKSIVGNEPNIDFLDFHLDSFAMNGESQEISLQTRAVSSITVIPDFLELSNVSLGIVILVQFDVDSVSDRFLLNGVSLSGTWTVGDSVFDFTIVKTGLGFICEGVPLSGTLEIGKFVQSLGSPLLPEGDLEGALRNSGLNRVRIDNAMGKGRYKSGQGFAVVFSGTQFWMDGDH